MIAETERLKAVCGEADRGANIGEVADREALEEAFHQGLIEKDYWSIHPILVMLNLPAIKLTSAGKRFYEEEL